MEETPSDRINWWRRVAGGQLQLSGGQIGPCSHGSSLRRKRTDQWWVRVEVKAGRTFPLSLNRCCFLRPPSSTTSCAYSPYINILSLQPKAYPLPHTYTTPTFPPTPALAHPPAIVS